MGGVHTLNVARFIHMCNSKRVAFAFNSFALSLQMIETLEELQRAKQLDDSVALGHKLRSDLLDEHDCQCDMLVQLFEEKAEA